MVNKVTFIGFRGAIAPIWIRPWVRAGFGLQNEALYNSEIEILIYCFVYDLLYLRNFEIK